MSHFWIASLLVLVTGPIAFLQAGEVNDKDFQFQGKLAKDDPLDAQRGGPKKIHTVPLKAGRVYTFDMVSKEMDSYLRLLDAKDNQLDEDDDSGGNLNARIIFNCSKDGEYKIVCTTVGGNMAGSYTLAVKVRREQPPASVHALLIGKSAPDIKADFAVNGTPVKLQDLKGKVVLLDFCEIRSGPCATLLPRLNEWHKVYKSKDLAVVGVTFYPSDIGQALSFNRTAGLLVTVSSSDHNSDQALLNDFAGHHKVKHLLMALPNQAALDAFDAYAVNSVPQVVLIDRKGIIRLIEVAGEKASTSIEGEIKKLLAEK